MKKYELQPIHYKVAAKTIEIVHIQYGIAVIIGSILALTGKLRRHPKLWLGLMMTLLGNSLIIEISDGCPLTKAEKYLLLKHNPDAMVPETFTGGLARVITKREFKKKTIRTGVHIWIGILLLINALSYLHWKKSLNYLRSKDK